jgi:gluconokinase
MDQHLWIIIGPSGCGKTTVGKYLADSLRFSFIEGDEYHSATNCAKMASGIPLTDSDRTGWLIDLSSAALAHLSSHNHVVVACSALKVAYRDVFRLAVANCGQSNVQLHFVYLQMSEGLARHMVGTRKGHYMPATLVRSQFEALEEPGKGEVGVDCMVLNAERQTAKLKEDVVELVRWAMGQE